MCCYRGAVSKLEQFIVMAFHVLKTKVHGIAGIIDGWERESKCEFKLIETNFSG